MPTGSTESTAPANHRPVNLNPNPNPSPNIKVEVKNCSNFKRPTNSVPDPNPSIKIEGWEEDAVLARSKFLHRREVLKRRHRRIKQLQRIYRDSYWALMEEVKHKHREYYWKYGKNTFQEDEDKVNALSNGEKNSDNCVVDTNCGVHGCKSKAMALTRFCHMHILSDSKQKLYKACNYAIKSSPTGPILCGKPILRSTVPSYCSLHFQKAEKHVTRALKKAGLNVSNTSKLAPKFHVIVAEYVSQIQNRRRAAQKAALGNAHVKEETSS